MSRPFDPERPIPLEELLHHAHWLRRLAAGLVRDPAGADDLVQDTWLAAIRHPPLAGAPPRPWLERVFRNLARNRRRDERTRAEHEPRAIERHPSLGPDAIAQEVEAQRLLAEAVGRLPDPARTIVVLRYFRGLDASAIGRELGMPAGTVRWKLKAALEELRHDLDRRFEGGRKAWSLVLGRVLAAAASPAAPVSLGWLAVAAASLMVVCAGWWSVRRVALAGDGTAPVPVEAASTESAPAAALLAPRRADGSAPDVAARPAASRVPLDAFVPPPAATDDAPDIRGSVLVDGAPPRGPIDLELVVFGTDRKLSTDEAGRFEVFALGDGESFSLGAPGYLVENDAAFWLAPVRETPCLDLVLSLRTPPAVRGRVVTHDGVPVPNARGVYELRAEASEWTLVPGRAELVCDAEGRFELPLLDLMGEGMPKLCEGETWEGVLLFEVARAGRGLFDLLPGPARDLELGDLILEPVRGLAFTVRDEHGLPLSRAVARVDDSWLASPSSPTNRDGRGELRHVPDRAVPVRFSALGYRDRVLLVEPGERPVVWLEPSAMLEVQLEPPADTYGPFPELRLTAHDDPFEPNDAPQSEFSLFTNAIQGELGASPFNSRGRVKDQDGLIVGVSIQPDAGGKVLITGLRAEVAFAVEARDASGRVLARRELVLTPGERRHLVLPYGE